jgi:uncharacterized protein
MALSRLGTGRSLARALIILIAAATANHAAAKIPPACGGRHILDDMKNGQPETYQRIRAAADATPNARNILWRIEKAGVAASHLFGTAHVTDQRLTQLSEPTKTLIQASRIVLLELPDTDPGKFAKLFDQMPNQFFTLDGPTVQSALTPDEYATLTKRLGEAGEAAPFQAWFYTALLATPACEGARMEAGLLSVDETISKLAKQRKIPVGGLETEASQVKAMASVPQSDQIAHLKSAIRLSDRTEDQHETINRLYLERDLGAIWPLSLELAKTSGVDQKSFDSFEATLIISRNKSMHKSALPHLAKGNTFIAVGALHLPGANGLVALLSEAGYTVVPVE